MSINNIFDCCKKTEILLSISGIVLGTYATNLYLHNPIKLNDPINIPITLPDNDLKPAPQPIDIPINIPQPINIPLSPPISYFTAFMNSTRVALRNGLAYLTINTGITITITATTYLTLKILLGRLFKRIGIVRKGVMPLGKDSFITGKITEELAELVDKYGVANSYVGEALDKQLREYRKMYKEKYKKFKDENIPPDENQIEFKDTKPYEKLKRYERINKPKKDYRNKHKKKSTESYFFDFTQGKSNTIFFFDQPELNLSQSDKVLLEQEEKEEVNENIQENLEQVREIDNEIQEIVNNTEVNTDMELYQLYTENMNNLVLSGLTINIPVSYIDEIFNRLNLPYQARITNQFSIDVNFNPNPEINNFDRLYHASYTDLQTFLSYGNKFIEGDVEVTYLKKEIKINMKNMKIVNKDEKMDIIKLDFSDKTYPGQIKIFYTKALLPLLAVLKKIGISQYSVKIDEMFANVLDLKVSKFAIKNLPSFRSPKLKIESENKYQIANNLKLFKESLLNFNENDIKRLEEIDNLYLDMWLRLSSILSILKIVRQLFLGLQNK